MRGSPLLRTFIVLAALLVAGLALARLTARDGDRAAVRPPPAETAAAAEDSAALRVPFELILSARAKTVSLEGGAAAVKENGTAAPLTGTLELSGEYPVVFLRVTWDDPPPGHRFAKLRLEIPGKETLEHVFHAPGDIDDIWELP